MQTRFQISRFLNIYMDFLLNLSKSVSDLKVVGNPSLETIIIQTETLNLYNQFIIQYLCKKIKFHMIASKQTITNYRIMSMTKSNSDIFRLNITMNLSKHCKETLIVQMRPIYIRTFQMFLCILDRFGSLHLQRILVCYQIQSRKYMISQLLMSNEHYDIWLYHTKEINNWPQLYTVAIPTTSPMTSYYRFLLCWLY